MRKWILFCCVVSLGFAGEIVTLAPGMLQYKIVKQGGGQVVESYSKPLVRYKGREEFLDLDETFLGLKKGLVGMREGEVRILYIHEKGALLTLEVEVIKADATREAHAASNEDVSRFYF